MRQHVAKGKRASNAFMTLVALALCSAPRAAEGATCPAFSPLPVRPSAGNATAVALGEFTGDVNLDAVVTNLGVNAISSFRNLGNGDLFARNDYPAGRPPESLQQNGLAIADFDEDGREDLAVIKLLDATLTVMLGESAGAFRPHASFPTGAYPFDVGVGDFNADGHADAVVASYNGASITFYYGDGTGAFPTTAAESVGGFPNSLVVLDVDGDSFPEVVVTSDSGVEILFRDPGIGDGISVQTIAVTGAHLNAVTSGFFNRDLIPDLVVGDSTGSVRVLLGTGGKPTVRGAPVFTVGSAVPTGAAAGLAVGLSGLVARDLDGDGKTDVAAYVSNGGLLLDAGEPAVRFLTGDGSGGLAAAGSVLLGRYPTDIEAGDMNGDGALDLVVTDDAGVYVALNTCVPAVPLDITAASLEVVQVIQDEANRVPLVAGKRTVVRARATANRTVPDIDALLWRLDAGDKPIGAPLAPANVGGRLTLTPSPSRQRLNDLFLFDLPDDWVAGTVRLRLDVNPFGMPPEANASNNSLTASVMFLPAKKVKFTLVDWRWKLCATSDANGTECRKDAPSTGYTPALEPAKLDAIEAELRRMLPVAAIQVKRRELIDDGVFVTSDIGMIVTPATLAIVRNLRQSMESNDPGTIFLWINSHIQGGGSAPNDSRYPEWRWDTVIPAIPDTALHEVGHLLRREHADCAHTEPVPLVTPYPGGIIGGPAASPEQFVGFSMNDASTPRPIFAGVVGSSTGDLMSYCAPRWPSDVTYSAMRQVIENWPELIDPIGDFLLASGTVTSDGAIGSLSTTARLPQVASLSPVVPGPFRLRLTDAVGAVLAEHGFVPFDNVDNGSQADPLGFVESMPWPPGTRRIALVNAAGTVLDQRVVSAHAPVVASLSQSGGAVMPPSGAVTVGWSGSDADGDPLLATVQYSFDAGATWTGLAAGLGGSSFTFDAARLAGTRGHPDGRLRVLLGDGVLTGYADSAPFVVPDKAPRLRIASPLPGSRYELGQTVALEAVVEDPEDGALDGAAIAWSSDLDGPLGSGRLQQPRLTEGTHQLSVVATDTEGASTTATVTVKVARALDPGRPPVADAGSDLSAFEGQTVTLDGSRSSDADGDPLLFSWSLAQRPSVETQVENGGTAAPAMSVPDDGVYLLDLAVSDGLNAPATDQVKVTVNNIAPTVTLSSPPPGQLLQVGQLAVVRASFTDPGRFDVHTCTVNWDIDQAGFAAPGIVDPGAGTCTATRSLAAGVYTIAVSVDDGDGGVGTGTVQIVVYDPSAGFVVGGGWINSLPGSYVPDPAATGKATFGFVSKYQKGKSLPVGETEFSFAGPGFKFKSTSYQWLVVNGAGSRAQYKGEGTVNGSGGYGFLLTAEDGQAKGRADVDRFRIKVWNRVTGLVVYDNAAGAPEDINSASPQTIGGGSITIQQ